MLQVEVYVVGPVSTNCYLISDEETGRCALIDPGANSSALESAVRARGVRRFDYILLTHGHFDHIGAVDYYRELTGAKMALYRGEESFLRDGSLNLSASFGMPLPPVQADLLLEDGESLFLGKTEIRLIHTPGHTAGSCCYLAGNLLFSGDTLFLLSAGRTDFATGDEPTLRASLQKLFALPGDAAVYPGHDEQTTLRFERENNPYAGSRNYDYFD